MKEFNVGDVVRVIGTSQNMTVYKETEYSKGRKYASCLWFDNLGHVQIENMYEDILVMVHKNEGESK